MVRLVPLELKPHDTPGGTKHTKDASSDVANPSASRPSVSTALTWMKIQCQFVTVISTSTQCNFVTCRTGDEVHVTLCSSSSTRIARRALTWFNLGLGKQLLQTDHPHDKATG